MFIKSLTLRQFRNYEDVSVAFSKGLNVIDGKNGQGKTNLLESLVYLSLTKSHRVHQDIKMIQDGKEFAKLQCVFQEDCKDKHLQAIIYPKGKSLAINHVRISKITDFIGKLNVIVFSPDDMFYFNAAKKEHRRIFNREISKLSAKYINALANYQNLLKNTNILLKSKRIDEVYLTTLYEQMAKEEYVIVTERKKITDGINRNIQDLYRYVSKDDNAKVFLQYLCCVTSEISYENILRMHLDSQNRDIQTKNCNVGIHREDFKFIFNETPANDTASQGQRRMMMLSFKLALHQHIRYTTSRNAVLLLDDVLSELDESKQVNLLEMIDEDVQCIITTTSLPNILLNRPVKRIHITNGTIQTEEI